MSEAHDLLLERLRGVQSAATWEENHPAPTVAPFFPAFKKHFLGLVEFDTTQTELVAEYLTEVFKRLHQAWEHAHVAAGKEAMLHVLDQILEQALEGYQLWLAERLDREPLYHLQSDATQQHTGARSGTRRKPTGAVGNWRSEEWPTEPWTIYPERPIHDMIYAFRGMSRRDREPLKMFRTQVSIAAATGIQRWNPHGNRGHGPFVAEQAQALDALQQLANELNVLRAALERNPVHLIPSAKAAELVKLLDAHKDAVLNSVRAAATATKRERELDALPAIGSHADAIGSLQQGGPSSAVHARQAPPSRGPNQFIAYTGPKKKKKQDDKERASLSHGRNPFLSDRKRAIYFADL